MEWCCEVCFTTFSRPEHLKRHSASHDTARPHVCPCGNSFKRSDALRRHERTCRSRGSGSVKAESHSEHQEYVNPEEIPQPKRVCLAADLVPIADITQVSHSALAPFDIAAASNTLSGERECNISPYPHVQNDKSVSHHTSDDSSFSDPFLDPAHLLQNMPSPLDFSALDLLFSSQITSDIILAERLEHLAYFTSSTGMSTFTDRESFRWRQNLVANAYEDKVTPVGRQTHPGPQDLAPIPVCDPLVPKSLEILQNLRNVTCNKRNHDIITFDWSSETHDQCQIFFSTPNIRRFLEYFWSLWYPNCPIIHKPLFNPRTAIPALISVMVVIGACLSPYEEDAKAARKWLDSIEEFIFSDECFRDNPPPSGNDLKWKKKRLQIIQAGYLVCSLQKREGPKDAQARIRRYRHASMVTLARQIGIGSAFHRNLKTHDGSQMWWQQFVEEEEMKRTITFVFLIDAAQVIFHNSPPRIMVSELKMDVSCPEACFQAESAGECLALFEEWTKTRFWRRKVSIVSAVRQICQAEIDDDLVQEFSAIGTLNLFTMVQAIHSLMFHLQNSLIFKTTFAPVQTGLDNWRRIWDKRIPEDNDIPVTAENAWKLIGFLRHASEFWHLARIKTAKIVSMADDDQTEDEDTYETSRYDHTDMGEVNGLIMEYRRMNLGMI
ncbi:uncharacterized protein N7511_000472 [Penicillium nucicola]|uniref:uncharacterized protein n=1 Tax=Penicillium nucicola TaxID=1850975 RepID=UPI002544D338|nr:uncharacterized protein N7511_000472 [Penicillium nucicola]KAJ5775461.1 hypothetical protein N7511_000472 [Penicillium nucicola]